jgi:hypothetical protein
MAQPNSFRQNEMNQVQRYSTTNQGPGVVVGETVNSEPASWIQNGSENNLGFASDLQKQVLSHTSA